MPAGLLDLQISKGVDRFVAGAVDRQAALQRTLGQRRGLVRNHVGQEEDDQRRAGKGQTAGIQIRLQQRPADENLVDQQPDQEQRPDREQPNVAQPLLAVGHQQQPRREGHEPDQVEIADAEKTLKLEEDAQNHQRRHVEPCRRQHFPVDEDILHRFARTEGVVWKTGFLFRELP